MRRAEVRPLDPRRRLARDRGVLTLFLARQAMSLGILITITVMALRLPDKRMGWILAPVVLAFAGYIAYVAIPAVRRYRQRAAALATMESESTR
jgi:TRAP-type C4-dicarboxylate transport system permease small subunit